MVRPAAAIQKRLMSTIASDLDYYAESARRFQISSAAVEAFRAGDYHGLHRVLDLRPWEASPLPVEVTVLGIDRDERPVWLQPEGIADWCQAVELQRRLIEAAGKAL